MSVLRGRPPGFAAEINAAFGRTNARISPPGARREITSIASSSPTVRLISGPTAIVPDAISSAARRCVNGLMNEVKILTFAKQEIERLDLDCLAFWQDAQNRGYAAGGGQMRRLLDGFLQAGAFEDDVRAPRQKAVRRLDAVNYVAGRRIERGRRAEAFGELCDWPRCG